MPLKKQTITKSDKEPAKVRKANELGSGWGFLSGLWFTQKKVEVSLPQDHDDTIITSPVPQKVQKKVATPVSRPQNDFLSNVLAGKDEIIVPKKVELKEIHDEPKTKSWPDLSFFDWVKRYEAPKKPSQAPSSSNKFQWPRWNIQTRPGQYHPKSVPTPQKHSQAPVAPVVKKVEKIATTSANLVKKIEIVIDEKISVKEFSEKMGIPLPQVMKKLMENKIMTSITASLDFDTASLIAEELWVSVKRAENTINVESFMNDDLQSILALDKDAQVTEQRPPIVTIMWHVDHGKTSLLDYLRKTWVASGEAGWITQSIWASVVVCNGKKVCFIDTPWHELFTSLRARWAKLTNIAVIVVAADDSVMPQTVESIGHAKEAGVPIIIAITKIDKPGKNIDQIKQDLAKYEIIPEDWGWDVPVIGVSSKTWQGIEELLETILLQSEILDLKFDPTRAAAGVILDAYKDPKQGVVSTMIVMTGNLKVWDTIVAYNTYGKVRRMQNWKGQNIQKAFWGDPVQILWITSLPEPGRIAEVVKNEKEAQAKVALIQEHAKKNAPESAIHQFISGVKTNKESELRLILKSDGSSSLEALKQAVAWVVLPKNVTIRIVHSDVWYFSDSDIALWQASSALLLGFNISLNALLKKKAENLKVEMKSFDIIYELTDYLSDLVKGMIKIEMEEISIWKLDVLAIFYSKSKEMVIWGKVIEGIAKWRIKFRIIRNQEIIWGWDLLSVYRNKDEVKHVWEGEECGCKVHTNKKIEEHDIIEFLEMQEVKD